MIYVFFANVGILFFFFALAVVFHEIGHVVAYKLFVGKFPKLKFTRKGTFPKGENFIEVGRLDEFEKLSKIQRSLVYIFGIVAGIPFLLPLPDISFVLAFVAYAFGCMHDFKNLGITLQE